MVGALPLAVEILSEDRATVPGANEHHGQRNRNENFNGIELEDRRHSKTSTFSESSSPTAQQIPHDAKRPDVTETPSPKTPNELEQSQPPTPTGSAVVGIVPSWSYPKMNKYRVISTCLEYFGNGINDSAPGALIPYIESWYHIQYAVVSLIWIANAVGFILAAFATDFIRARLGRARSLMLSEAFMIAAYAVIASPVPFAVVVVAYLFLGFGNALNLALNNVFCANLANATVILGASQGSYGIGGVVGPILATSLVSNGIHWSRFYFIPIGVRFICMAFAGWSFWDYEKEQTTHFGNRLQQIASRQSAGEGSKSRQILTGLKNRVTIVGALFIFAYQGAEVSESGWFISYLIDHRHGDPKKIGYVTSGFWGGITIGRFVLTHLAHRVGEKVFVYVMAVGVIVFQLMAWLIPSIIGDAVSVAILGLLLGPVYPCAQTIFTHLLPESIQVFSVGFISSAGSSGGAVVPFLTGLLTQEVGTFVLHPVCIAAYVVMIACWVGLPRTTKRKE